MSAVRALRCLLAAALVTAPWPQARAQDTAASWSAAAPPPAAVRAEEQARVTEGTRARTPLPTPLWLLTQAIPSPQVLMTDGPSTFGLRWQVTPLLYSFGVHRRVSPWRVLVAEPLVRYSGSLELYGAPEYLAFDDVDSRWGLRGGWRVYLPVLHRGEYLAVSLGSSALHFDGEAHASAELGGYVLFGILGLQFDASPTLGGGSLLMRLSVRYF